MLRTKNICIKWFFRLIIIYFSLTNVLEANNVRGQIISNGPYGSYPVQGIAVTLHDNISRSIPSYTDRNGIYFFQYINPGTYKLEIWRGNIPIIYTINVFPNLQITDIQPIIIH